MDRPTRGRARRRRSDQLRRHQRDPRIRRRPSRLVFAGERSAEFAARMSGRPYSAGGIASTVATTRAADDATLLAGVQRLTDELFQSQRHDFECKSGYGLTVEDEVHSLRIAKAVTDETTFLGAHVVQTEFRDDREAYIEMVEAVRCFRPARRTPGQVMCSATAAPSMSTRLVILTAGMAAGLDARLHAGQLGPSAGIRLAVELGAASVDHCTCRRRRRRGARRCGRHHRGHAAARRRILSARAVSGRSTARRCGDRRALATDCNPGSSFTTSVPFCIAVAVRDMNFTPAQALWATTAGGAAAPCAATTSGSSPSGGGRISFGWTPRRTCTSRTGPVCRWFVMS